MSQTQRAFIGIVAAVVIAIAVYVLGGGSSVTTVKFPDAQRVPAGAPAESGEKI